jgi:hypothetical protein
VISLVPASLVHVGPIASRMREWDKREAAAFGRSPKEALRIGLSASLWAYTALVDGRPEAMLGLTPVSLIEGRGVPWMLGTDAIYAHPREMLRGVGPMIAGMQADCRLLENWVATGNARAMRFLRGCGFSFYETRDIGGLEMRRFGLIQA